MEGDESDKQYLEHVHVAAIKDVKRALHSEDVTIRL